jgi:beta-lactamase superfamily II metal-dependent hydrolase
VKERGPVKSASQTSEPQMEGKCLRSLHTGDADSAGTHLDHHVEELARASEVVVRECRLDEVARVVCDVSGYEGAETETETKTERYHEGPKTEKTETVRYI